MTVATQQDNLQLLADNLQEHLRADVPSGEFFGVRCAVKNHQLMILTQHPQGVAVDTENIFTVLKEALSNNSREYPQEKVEIFLRVAGVKLPYSKRSLTLEKQYGAPKLEEAEEDNSIPDSSALTYSPVNETEDDFSNSLAQNPLPEDSQPNLAGFNPKLIVLSMLGVMICATLGGAYVATRPCLITTCTQLKTAQYLDNSYGELIKKINSEQDLARLQRKIDKANTNLRQIPGLSPYSQESQQLSLSLSDKSSEIQKVFTAFQAAQIAEQKSKTPASSLKQLQDRQRLWRQAISPLEAINSDRELYQFAQEKLRNYRANLQAVNALLQKEDKYTKKITSAKAVAIVAEKRQATARSLQDWQKVQATWQVALNALTPIPAKSPAYSDAQKLISEYKPRLLAAKNRTTKELMAAKTYRQAVNAVSLAKRYERQNQWTQALMQWQTAVSSAKQVATSSLYSVEAEKIITPASVSLEQAREKLRIANRIQKTRSDLERTCSGEIRVCTYIMGNQGITVRISPDYEQNLQENLLEASTQGDTSIIDGVNNHLQTLQQALEAISDNADVPLIVYDAQGNVIYERTLN
ncbi:hypothetical protein Riv7116_0438 [Rivularia sp. PCC 7116]|uniref:hypothetical protein n=1 Tax=Rivularia sp. PCC 7116 TaxID=373994 RepID=UPI00029ECFB3|nr:hypothetical protein [Rivularia sp. PCC 7116]AFY53041.1 hypothetical protein Riv7116_0438 [Rivularia sp. PCC 7116]